MREGSCNWKPLLQTTFSPAISHYPSQRSAAWCVLEADFKHHWKKPRAGSRISAKWALWRRSSPDHPQAPTSEFQELMFSPSKARYCSEAQVTAKCYLVKHCHLAFPGVPNLSFISKQRKSTTCHSSLPKAARLWTTGPHNTSAQVMYILLSSPFPRLKQDIRTEQMQYHLFFKFS